MNKKVFLVLTALFAAFVSVNAQSFDILYQDKILDEGATVAINATENEFGELACHTNPPSTPNKGLVLKLNDATTAEVYASMQILSNTLNPSQIQWCMGGDCITLSSYSTKNKNFTAKTIEQVQFDATNIHNEGLLEASLSITIGGVTKRVNILLTNNPKQTWWNYYNNEGTWYVNGTYTAERYYVATYVPYGYLGGGETSINGLSFYFLDSDVKDVEYWVSTSLPDFGGQADLETISLPLSDLRFNQFNEVKFKKSHVVPQGGLYVGYSFTISSLDKKYSNYPISYRKSEMLCSEGYYYCTSSNTSWSNLSGDLMVRILSEGQLKNNAVNVFADDHIYTLKNSEQTMDVKIQNVGAIPVRSLKYVIETDGAQVASGTCKVSIPDMMTMTTVSIPIPTDMDAAIYDRNIIITEVNSQVNESDNNKTSAKQYNMLEKSQFVPLFEEFTGTWCGWCVRGIVAMNRAHEQYGDKAAIIAIHNGDPMGIDDYKPIIEAFCDGYPTGVANRAEPTGIDTNTVVDNIKNTLDNLTPASIEAGAYWANDEQTTIRVDTKTTFQLNMPGHYAIAYILTEDGMTGTGSEWRQSNFYSGESASDPDLQYWCSQPRVVTGVVFDHVAVAVWQPLYGVEGSVENDIKAGVPQNFSYIADISNNKIIQDKSKLKMITLLLNSETGEYINAAITPINEFAPTAIDETHTAAPKINERYSLDGQKLTEPQRGINIIRMSDGTVKKVVVK